jgi:predicted regulator of Ras-like GTPase activity (Roadblock/LC7/MglB family)
METILSEIGSVPGVTGAMVLAKDSQDFYHLLPPTFTHRAIAEMGNKMLGLSQRLSPHTRLNLKFECGIGLVYNLPRSVILIFGRPDMDLSLLGLTLKWALQSIEREVEAKLLQPVDPKATSASAIDRGKLELLIEAINLVAQGCARDQGTFWVTKNLRKAKQDVIKEFPQASSFCVDNHGSVSISREPEQMLDQRTSLALVKWIDLFLKEAPHPARRDPVADVRELTARISKPLEGIGFYDLYTKVTRKLV